MLERHLGGEDTAAMTPGPDGLGLSLIDGKDEEALTAGSDAAASPPGGLPLSQFAEVRGGGGCGGGGGGGRLFGEGCRGSSSCVGGEG